MKSILMSFSPYWYYLIGERVKGTECRKVKPKSIDWNGMIECYMTKDEKSFALIPDYLKEKYRKHFGKVGMRFRCDKIDEFERDLNDWIPKSRYDLRNTQLADACLTEGELWHYGHGMLLYGLRISDLHIYDTPRELGEFVCRKPLQRPPQSWCYVEVSK